MKQIYIPVLDNGHGCDTKFKRSPIWKDGTQLLEYEFNRNIVRRIAKMLDSEGIEYRILVPEEVDISLGERCRRANRIYQETNKKSFVVSVHANAGGGTGWEVWTSPGETKSDKLATIFYEEAKRSLDFKMRADYSDGDPDKESKFYILVHTQSPALLTENLFMDTERDCRYIMSEKGRDEIARIHVNAIKRIIYG